MPEQQQQQSSQPAPWNQESRPFEGGPRNFDGKKPDTSKILKALRKVESDQAKKYRQRSGQ